MNDLNMKLLKQHVAILQTHMESVSRVLDSLATDAELLEGEMAERIRRLRLFWRRLPRRALLRKSCPRPLRICALSWAAVILARYAPPSA